MADERFATGIGMIWLSIFTSALSVALALFGIWINSPGFVVAVVVLGISASMGFLALWSESEDD